MTFVGKYNKMLEDQNISRWFDNLRAKSYLTATVYLRGLGYYCELTGSSPYSIINDAKSGKLRNDFMDFVRKMEREGKAGSYISRIINFSHTYPVIWDTEKARLLKSFP